MNSLEIPQKELTAEEMIFEKERKISVEIERRVMEKYAPLFMLKNNQLSLEQARFEWIKKYALDFRRIFNLEKGKILEMYSLEGGLEETADFIEKELEKSQN
jgi:hypothetical protein